MTSRCASGRFESARWRRAVSTGSTAAVGSAVDGSSETARSSRADPALRSAHDVERFAPHARDQERQQRPRSGRYEPALQTRVSAPWTASSARLAVVQHVVRDRAQRAARTRGTPGRTPPRRAPSDASSAPRYACASVRSRHAARPRDVDRPISEHVQQRARRRLERPRRRVRRSGRGLRERRRRAPSRSESPVGCARALGGCAR